MIIDKEHDGEIVAYFGIKCGMISSPFPSEIYDINLFAADSSKRKTLIKYYEQELGFTTLEDYDKKLLDDSDIVPIMPYYDYECKFMFVPLY